MPLRLQHQPGECLRLLLILRENIPYQKTAHPADSDAVHLAFGKRRKSSAQTQADLA